MSRIKRSSTWIIALGIMIMILFSLHIGVFAASTNVSKRIALNEKRVVINKGGSFTLFATVTGMEKPVTWKSSNKKVASVKGGVVTGRRKGTATITAKCGKLKAKCKVTVKKNEWLYHIEKGNIRYEEYRTPNYTFNLIIDIKGDELIVEGDLIKSNRDEYAKGVRVKGKKHVFRLSSNTKYWSGDMAIGKDKFLYYAKEYKSLWANLDTTGIIIDLKDGVVVDVGFV